MQLPHCLTLLACLLLLVTTTPALADIRLPKIFSDGMVLQRQSEITLWGMADANEELSISITGRPIETKQLKTTCDQKGHFQVKINTLPVGGPYEMEIVGASSTVRIRDILVGDVWLCSGQSNMAMTVADSQEDDLLPGTTQSQLRLLNIERTASPRPLEEFTGVVTWQSATTESAKQFSAVGYFFGRQLQQSQKVPIGIINASWGGTLCEAWTSQQALENTPALKPLFDYGQSIPDGLQKQDQHASLFNGMISPLQQIAVKGVVWYQGESNVGRGAQYATLFPTMISDWRKHFSRPDLPFLFVQLAPYHYQDRSPQALAEVWDAQLKTVLQTPRTGMAVTVDLGNADDIHPKDKFHVAERLADWALAEVYNDQRLLQNADSDQPLTLPAASTSENNATSPADSASPDKTPVRPIAAALRRRRAARQQTQEPAATPEETTESSRPYPVPYASPLFKTVEIVDQTAVVSFFAGQGLSTSDGQPVREFQVAGEDQVFHPAEASIVNDQIHVYSVRVPKPVAVRYAFHETPDTNLINKSGLPASPFRSDSFPLQSDGKDY